MDTFFQQVINGLVLGSLYSLIALGYTMVYGILNLINFAHGDVLMVGALTALTTILFLKSQFPEMPGWLLLMFGTSDPAADLDGSGTVDSGDIGLLLLLFG